MVVRWYFVVGDTRLTYITSIQKIDLQIILQKVESFFAKKSFEPLKKVLQVIIGLLIFLRGLFFAYPKLENCCLKLLALPRGATRGLMARLHGWI